MNRKIEELPSKFLHRTTALNRETTIKNEFIPNKSHPVLLSNRVTEQFDHVSERLGD
jgi:hypothetical protein